MEKKYKLEPTGKEEWFIEELNNRQYFDYKIKLISGGLFIFGTIAFVILAILFGNDKFSIFDKVVLFTVCTVITFLILGIVNRSVEGLDEKLYFEFKCEYLENSFFVWIPRELLDEEEKVEEYLESEYFSFIKEEPRVYQRNIQYVTVNENGYRQTKKLKL